MANHSFRGTTALLAFSAFLTLTGDAQPQSDRARTEALARRASERQIALQREADRLASEESSLLNDLRKLEVDRQLKAEQLKEIDREAATLQADIAATEEKMNALQASEASTRPELRARLVEMYKLGRARYARLLLSSPDLQRLGQASRTVAVLAKLDRDRIAEHERMLADLKSSQATLEERTRQVAATRIAAQHAQAAAARAAQAQSDLVREIDQRRDLNAQLAGELQSAQIKLQAALRDAGGATPPDVTLPVRAFRGDLEWPVGRQGPIEIRRRFGRTAAARGGSSNGMEIAAPDGVVVTAVHDGLVAFAGTFASFGNLVILDHGSQTFSLYGNLLDIGVAKGNHVDRGQKLGTVGPLAGGGSGLYFELRIDGQPVDPLQWLKKR